MGGSPAILQWCGRCSAIAGAWICEHRSPRRFARRQKSASMGHYGGDGLLGCQVHSRAHSLELYKASSKTVPRQLHISPCLLPHETAPRHLSGSATPPPGVSPGCVLLDFCRKHHTHELGVWSTWSKSFLFASWFSCFKKNNNNTTTLRKDTPPHCRCLRGKIHFMLSIKITVCL